MNPFHHPLRRPSPAALLLSACLVLAAGCTASQTKPQLVEIGGFGESVDQLTTTISETMDYLADTLVKAYLLDYALLEGEEWDAVGFDTLEGVNLQLEAAFKSAFAAEALESLGNYARNLSVLANTDINSDVTGATTALNASLVSARDSYTSFTGDEVGSLDNDNVSLISSAANALGVAYAENLRARKLYEIMKAADPAVQQICNGIADKLGDGSYAMLLSTFQGSLFAEEFRRDKQALSGADYERKLEFLEASRARYLAMQNVGEEMQAIAAAARKVAETHSAIVEALGDDEVSFTRVMTLSSELALERIRLDNYRRSLKGEGGATTEE